MTDDDVTGFAGSLLETIGDAVVVVGRAGDIVYVNRRAEELLGLDPQARELSLVCGAVTGDGREVAMLTRSMLEILGEVSTFVEVPAAHVAEGRARAAAPLTGTELPIRINSGPSQPADSYAAVENRDHWFWIDDTDFRSKRVFTFLMIMLSLAETGSTANAPVLTVNAGS